MWLVCHVIGGEQRLCMKAECTTVVFLEKKKELAAYGMQCEESMQGCRGNDVMTWAFCARDALDGVMNPNIPNQPKSTKKGVYYFWEDHLGNERMNDVRTWEANYQVYLNGTGKNCAREVLQRQNDKDKAHFQPSAVENTGGRASTTHCDIPSNRIAKTMSTFRNLESLLK
jgi:hypothetical protein